MRSRIYILGAILVFLLLAVGTCRKAGTWLVKTDDPVHADAMIMLMGNISDRAVQTADLYKEKAAGKVWIVDAGMRNERILRERGVQVMSSSNRARYALIGLGVPEDSIVVLSGAATSTSMEAEITREYLLTQNGIDTLLLVTSTYHTRRAFKIFEAAFKPIEEPLTLYCSQSSYSRFSAEKWWRHRHDIEHVMMEYLKLANFYLFEKRDLRKGNR